ncbi:MAG: class I SAM-dependent methyltransferase [Sinobacteraceae bacterium]|nr:class I SAM-dependent methyltransferase [Nevskiaceae bacterium]
MSFKDHFSRLAAQYSAYRPAYPAALFDYLARSCPERQTAWDCACGNGQATLALAERFDSVIATDASPQQIAAATARANITYRVAPAERSGIESKSLDLVSVAQALHWFDLESFYREVERVLKTSGLLAVWTYGVLHVEGDSIDALLQEFYHDIVGPYWPPERRFVEEGYRGLAFPFTEISSPSFNMEEHWNREHLLGYLRTWSATGRYVEDKGVDPVSGLEGRLASIWNDAQNARKVTWPLALRVGRR